MESLTQIYTNLASYQYLILFPIITIEGPIATVIAGFIIAQGLMSIYIAYPLIIAGDLAGDIICYALGRWGKDFGLKLFGLTNKKLKKIEYHFDQHGGKTMLLGKLSHGIGAAFLFAAGAAHMPLKKFLFYNTVGTMPKSFILILIGYFFGHSYMQIGKYFDYFALSTLIIGIILLIGYLLITKKIRKEEGL